MNVLCQGIGRNKLVFHCKTDTIEYFWWLWWCTAAPYKQSTQFAYRAPTPRGAQSQLLKKTFFLFFLLNSFYINIYIYINKNININR